MGNSDLKIFEHQKAGIASRSYYMTFMVLLIGKLLAVLLDNESIESTMRTVIVSLSVTLISLLTIYIASKLKADSNLRQVTYLVLAGYYTYATVILSRSYGLASMGIIIGIFAINLTISSSKLHVYMFVLASGVPIIISSFLAAENISYVPQSNGVNLVFGVVTLCYVLMQSMKHHDELLRGLEIKVDLLDAANEDMSASNARLDAIISATEDAFIGFDTETETFEWSPGITEVFGIEDIYMKDGQPNFIDVVADDDRIQLREAWDGMMDRSASQTFMDIQIEVNGNRKDSRVSLIEYITQSGVRNIIVAIKDISTEKDKERVIQWKHLHNDLSGLLNYSGFVEAVNGRIAKGENAFYVALFDIDNFNYINDTFGYEFGDRVLKKIGDRLREMDEWLDNISHLDGDSFLFTVQESVLVSDLLEILRNGIGNLVVGGVAFKITGSLGVTTLSHGQDAALLIKNAEAAMFEVKGEGKNDFTLFNPDVSIALNEKFRLLQALDQAVENEEIFTVYQPKINSKSGKIYGFECLVRWVSEDLGFVSPIKFIPLAEQTGQIIDLGHFIIEEALKFTKKVLEMSPDVVVSINLSPRQLLEEGFDSMVIQMLTTAKVPAQAIAFEITETLYVENFEHVQALLLRIKKRGISISLDDFGTGYSSLSYLKRLPIDVLKIDKSFIDHIHEDKESADMVKAILNISDAMGINTVAEGVETIKQAQKLSEFGCVNHQGYLYSRPLPFEEAVELFVKEPYFAAEG